MPLFNTGNQTWDQNLNSLAGALFPDPSSIARAGYYGAEQRNAQLGAAQKTDQMANMHRLQLMAGGGAVPPPVYAPAPGQNMPPIMQDPNLQQAPPQAPSPQAPPASLGQVVAPGPGGPQAAPPPPAPPPQAAAPAAGTVGTGMAPGALSALVAQGGGAVPGQQPQVVGRGPTGGAIVAQTMSPGEVADKTPAMLAQAGMTSGTPPPVGQPAAMAPPAPNTTGSDGSVPGGDASSGKLHPASLTPPGGGRKMSGPANSDGSPAKPSFTLAQYVATAAAAGMDAQQAKLQGTAYIESLFQKGMIDEGTYHHMMGTMDPSIINQDTASRTQITTTGMQEAGATGRTKISEAGATQRTGMTIAGENTRKGMDLATVVTPGDPNQVRHIPLSQMQVPGGTPGFNPAAVPEAVKPVEVQPAGPGTPSYSQPQYLSQRDKTPLYQKGTEDIRQTQQGAVKTYVDLKNPTQLIPATAADAMRRGLVEAPTTMDGWHALAASASANEPDPQKAQAIRDTVLSFATATQPKALTANENVQNQNIIDRQLQIAMPVPVPTTMVPGLGGQMTNENPAGASPELSVTLENLTNQYFTRSTNPAIRGDRVASANAAIQQLIRDGYIDTKQNRGVGMLIPGRSGESSINKGVLMKDGSVEQHPHFRVDIVDPKTKKAFATGQAPQIAMTSSYPTKTLGSVVAGPPGGNQPMTAGGGGKPTWSTEPTSSTEPNAGPKIGQAPPGAVPGTPAWVGGQQGVVGTDGFVHAPG